MVIGTGDLSELALGWATYNGDHMSMYGVNASIPKTLVRHLVDYVARDNRKKDPELAQVLEDILDTPVSPELLPAVQGEISQRTEDLVGPYELHPSSSSSHSRATASEGIRQSPRGDRDTLPTLGPSGRQERLNCWAKNR